MMPRFVLFIGVFLWMTGCINPVVQTHQPSNSAAASPNPTRQTVYSCPIRQVALRLQAAGYWSGDVNTVTWTDLNPAVRQLQSEVGLFVTGNCDQQTWQQLQAITLESSSPQVALHQPWPEVQTQLAQLGYQSLSSATLRTALLQFQRDYFLTVTGTLTAETQALLNDLTTSQQPAPPPAADRTSGKPSSRAISTPAVDKPIIFAPSEQQQIVQLIKQQHYQRPEAISAERCCTDSAQLQTYLATLDPYSRYVTTAQQVMAITQPTERMNLGLQLIPVADQVLAVPLANGPAQAAGLLMPEWLTTINQQRIDVNKPASYGFLAQLTPEQSVTITTHHNGQAHQYPIRASTYQRQHVAYAEQAHQTLIRIHNFVDSDDRRLRQLINQANQRGQPLILDLRFCPGGNLFAAVDAASLLLPADLPVTTLLAQQQSPKTLTTLPGYQPVNIPISVWVSNITASTAEIFVRALAHHAPDIMIIGAPTKGKCLAQQSFSLMNGHRLELSVYALEDAAGLLCQDQPFIPRYRVAPNRLLDDEAYLNASP
jgi:carboxyl-terminal processing protease